MTAVGVSLLFRRPFLLGLSVKTDVFSLAATNLTGGEEDDSPTSVEVEGEVAVGLNGGDEDDPPTGVEEEGEVANGDKAISALPSAVAAPAQPRPRVWE